MIFAAAAAAAAGGVHSLSLREVVVVVVVVVEHDGGFWSCVHTWARTGALNSLKFAVLWANFSPKHGQNWYRRNVKDLLSSFLISTSGKVIIPIFPMPMCGPV